MILSPGQFDFSRAAYDVCVVGSGPAGTTVAMELAGSGARVCLLEGGGTSPDPRQADTYAFDSVGGWAYTGIGRSRYLGGSSNCWGGLCSRLDPIDFDARPWVTGSGWPVSLRELNVFYERAAGILDLKQTPFGGEDPSRFPAALGFESEELVPKRWSLSKPTKFGEKYLPAMKASSHLHLYLNTNVVDIELGADHRSVSALVSVLPSGKTAKVSAKRFVLACGGIENPRLLLNSARQQEAGVGNGSDNVGRCFMDHVYFNFAAELYPAPGHDVPEGFYLAPYGISHRGYWYLQLAPERQRRLRSLNTALRFDLEEPHQGGLPWGGGIGSSGRRVAFSLTGELPPLRSNRITLSAKKDFLGLRKSVVDVTVPAQTMHEYDTLLRSFVRFTGRTGIGRVRVRDGFAGLGGGSHHMGTTRMGHDPRSSVVDRDLRVHGVSNLFCAGSSVFPTSGCANPTWTIVALSLRLAEKLRGEL